MKKFNKKLTIILGGACAALLALSSWHSVQFNDSRFVTMMDLSHYTFRAKDLPMIISGACLALYSLYLFACAVSVATAKNKGREEQGVTRKINPKLGMLGFLGFFGLLGFWTYHVDKTVSPFIFFLFFGFFGFFYEGKMSNVFMDERYKENKMKAQLMANKTTISIIFIATLMVGQGKLWGSLEYTFIAYIIIVAFAIALGLFLGEFLLFHYDNDGMDGSRD